MVAVNEQGIKSEWETLEARHKNEVNEHLSRLKVDGGYLYRSFVSIDNVPTMSMCLVPEIDLSRYQSHLRDAYNKGYKDGQSDAKVGCRSDLEL